ncbi:hypothetical protein E2C01_083111 [Portunus trituberculatus]|uniref:Uncharacterized protein n=1 Tax=Portunus trituberculatus TaxID=210409 RepID=A0A5B7J124_PORTR|nr:hypothetical protein [Portunus trituberculatus]
MSWGARLGHRGAGGTHHGGQGQPLHLYIRRPILSSTWGGAQAPPVPHTQLPPPPPAGSWHSQAMSGTVRHAGHTSRPGRGGRGGTQGRGLIIYSLSLSLSLVFVTSTTANSHEFAPFFIIFVFLWCFGGFMCSLSLSFYLFLLLLVFTNHL